MSDKAQIGLRVSHEKKEMWQAIADEYSLSLTDLIKSHMPTTIEGAEIPEHTIKNSRLNDLKDRMDWRYTALHLKDNIARGYAHELCQTEPAKHTWVFDYLYPKYLGEAYVTFCETKPKQSQRYEETVKFLNKWQRRYETIQSGDCPKSKIIDESIKAAKTIHRSKGRDAALAFVSRVFDRHKLMSSEKSKIIRNARLDATDEDMGDLSFDQNDGISEGGFSD